MSIDKKKNTNQKPIQQRSVFVGDSLFPHFTVKNPVPKEKPASSQTRKIIVTGTNKKS